MKKTLTVNLGGTVYHIAVSYTHLDVYKRQKNSGEGIVG